jgi:hypothetical protein
MARVGVVIGVAVVTGVGVAKLLYHLSAIAKKKRLIPRVEFNKQGGITSVESFGDYVVRQLELSSEVAKAKNVAKVAEAYLKGDKSSIDDSRENACMLVSGVSEEGSEEEKRLYHEVLKELDACMLAYFSFHWKHASALTEQVQSPIKAHSHCCLPLYHHLHLWKFLLQGPTISTSIVVDLSAAIST